MLDALHKKNTGVRILLGVILGIISIGMLLYLVPNPSGPAGGAADTVAEVGGQQVSVDEVQRQMQRLTSSGAQIPSALRPYYAQQIVNQLVYDLMLELEAKRLGVRVTDQERAARIRVAVPEAFTGDTFVGMDRYAGHVQLRFQMGVPEFEELVRRGLLEEKFRRLVTDGIMVTPMEVEQEFRRRNEKSRVEYVVINPNELEAKVAVSGAEVAAEFEKNKSRYVVPERRVVRYAQVDANQLRAKVRVTEDELRAYFDDHIDHYRIQNRVHASHILFKTVGKTDAEIEEIRKKAEEVLKKARQGAKFEDLAQKNSEDTTKDKGGDLGWLVQGQTVPEFEKVAFSLPKGTISDLVRTQYGFHIIKVVDHENARTQSLDEGRAAIRPAIEQEKADHLVNEEGDAMAKAVRASSKVTLDDLAKQFNLIVQETRTFAADEPLGELGNSGELRDAAFRLRAGEVASPIRTERGYTLLSVKQIQPAHPATLDEVRDNVLADLRKDKAVELAKTRADELAKRAHSGEPLPAAAKAFGLEAKTSETFARTDSVPGAGSGKQLAAAFTLQVGQIGPPVHLGSNWVVFRVLERPELNPEDFQKQRADLEKQVLQSKRDLAYQTFHIELEKRLRLEGTLQIRTEVLQRLEKSG